MSNNTNNAAIGAFIVGAGVLALAAILFISGSGFGRDSDQVVMVFDGSVKGLTVGAPVALRGVQIGQVTEIDLIFDTDTIDIIMLVKAEFQRDHIQRRGSSDGDFTEEMIGRGLRAQLNSQSLLTGLLYVQLDFHPNSNLVLAEIDSPYAQIPTIPTELQRLSREIESIDIAKFADNLGSLAQGLNTFVNNDDFQQLPADMKATLAAVESLSMNLDNQLDGVGTRFSAMVDSATATFDSANTEIPKISASAVSTLSQFDTALTSFNRTMGELELLVADDSSTRYELNKALRELALAGKAMQLLAKTLEEQPQSILRGRSEDQP